MNKNCIISVANGGYYPACLDRMKESLKRTGYTGDLLTWENSYPPGCPDHTVLPYAFKSYAFQEAIKAGYKNVLWLDSAVWAIDSLEPIWKEISEKGYVLFNNYEHKTGTWCNDTCLKAMNKDREESFTYPHLMACTMGFNVKNPLIQEFLTRYHQYANDGLTFPGPWSNENNQASADTRVLGHRHDQTVASFLAWDMGLRNWQPMGGFNTPPAYLLYYNKSQDTSKLSKKTVLLSQGGITPGLLDKTIRTGTTS